MKRGFVYPPPVCVGSTHFNRIFISHLNAVRGAAVFTMSTTKHPADMAASDVDLAEGIDFQLRYLGSTRIFRYSSYHFRIDRPLAVSSIR